MLLFQIVHVNFAMANLIFWKLWPPALCRPPIWHHIHNIQSLSSARFCNCHDMPAGNTVSLGNATCALQTTAAVHGIFNNMYCLSLWSIMVSSSLILMKCVMCLSGDCVVTVVWHLSTAFVHQQSSTWSKYSFMLPCCNHHPVKLFSFHPQQQHCGIDQTHTHALTHLLVCSIHCLHPGRTAVPMHIYVGIHCTSCHRILLNVVVVEEWQVGHALPLISSTASMNASDEKRSPQQNCDWHCHHHLHLYLHLHHHFPHCSHLCQCCCLLYCW